jgi:hypothetical protein
MAKLPYGGIELNPPQLEPWKKLHLIQQHLERAEVIPPDLAQWLGSAIAFSDNNPSRLLERLDLKKTNTRPRRDDWLEWAVRFDELAGERGKEAAIEATLQEAVTANGGDEPFSRATLQRWHKEYEQLCHESWKEAWGIE